MKHYEPIPVEESRHLIMKLAGKSLEEIFSLLGPPTRELAPIQWQRHLADGTIEVTNHVRSLEFVDLSQNIKSVLVHVSADGKLEFTFRGRELSDAPPGTRPQE